MYKIYDHILQGSEATEKNAFNFATYFNFSDVETEEKEMPKYSNFIETVNDIDIYYCFGADYYFFTESD